MRHIRVVGRGAGQSSWVEALAHGRAVVNALLGQGSRQILVPRILETAPSLAQIGSLLDSSGQQAPGEVLLRQSFAENDRAVAIGAGRGLAKVSVDGRGKVLRAAILGPQAPELAAVLALAMDQRIDLAALAQLPLPRPSLFSILVRLAESYGATKPASAWTSRRRTLRRFTQNPFGG